MNVANENLKKRNFEHRHTLLDKLGIVRYFDDKVKITLFFCGNEHFIEQAKLDLHDIREAEKTNKTEKTAWRTNALKQENIHEAEVSDLEKLFAAKFEEAKIQKGFRTKSRFAKHEAEEIELRQSDYLSWFPILKQWLEFLKKRFPSQFKRNAIQQSNAGKTGTRRPDEPTITKIRDIIKAKRITRLTSGTIYKLVTTEGVKNVSGKPVTLSWIKKHLNKFVQK